MAKKKAAKKQQPVVEVGESIPEEEGALVSSDGEKPAEATTAIVPASVETVLQGKESTWEWTKQKRKAFRQVMDGVPFVDIAKNLGIHRNTLRNWMLAPEWANELKIRVQEKQLSSKLRRLTGFEELTDKTIALASKALDGDEDDNGHRHISTTLTGMLLKESRELVKTERELFGEAPAKSGGGGGGPQQSPVNININGPLPASLEGGTPDTLATVSFKDFLLHVSKPGDVIEADTVEDAVVLKTRELLQKTDVLDRLHDEDKERSREEAAKEESTKRRR